MTTNNSFYMKSFTDQEQAYRWMKVKNQTNREKGQMYCLMDGPENDFVVCDIKTAIDTGLPYEWEA